jgi:hypothetical protein
MDEYLEALDESNRRNNGLPPKRPALPEGLRRTHTSDRSGTRQVGLRLPGEDFESLVEMGQRYGLAPASLARMLVVRAVREQKRRQG